MIALVLDGTFTYIYPELESERLWVMPGRERPLARTSPTLELRLPGVYARGWTHRELMTTDCPTPAGPLSVSRQATTGLG
jgi:hypothetical protein